MTNIRGRQEEILENLNSYRTTQIIFHTSQTELRTLAEANRSIMENLVTRVNMSRFIRNYVGLIPTLNSSLNKTGFTVTANHNSDTAWNVFNYTPGSFWDSSWFRRYLPTVCSGCVVVTASGVTTVVAATAVMWGPAGSGGPARPGLIMSTVTRPQWINKYEIKQLYLVDQILTEISYWYSI